MCARFALEFAGELPESLKRALASPLLLALADAVQARIPSVRPTDRVPVIHGASDAPVVEPCAWGLIPRWARDATIARHTFNARVETLAEKPAFRDAFRHRRCLVPVSRWIEWTGPAGQRTPVAIAPPHGLGAFAGLWDSWRAPDGALRRTFTVVTCPPVAAIAHVHDRMPLLLAPADWPRWLDGRPSDPVPDPLEGPYAVGAWRAAAKPPARRAMEGSPRRSIATGDRSLEGASGPAPDSRLEERTGSALGVEPRRR
jgi:putative SOS response-associated peptidase YedK